MPTTKRPLSESVGLLVGLLIVAASIIGSAYAVWDFEKHQLPTTPQAIKAAPASPRRS